MNPSNYPPGVTGNEPEIAGDGWDDILNIISEDAETFNLSDIDVVLAWRLGRAALTMARVNGAKFPHDSLSEDAT